MADRSTISAPIGAGACPTGWRLPKTLPDMTGSIDGHSWPEPDDAAAFGLMQGFAADPAPFRAEAEAISIRIRKEFGAKAVTARLLAALDTVG